jgi:tetratricopeptide (TPR) repeat protein
MIFYFFAIILYVFLDFKNLIMRLFLISIICILSFSATIAGQQSNLDSLINVFNNDKQKNRTKAGLKLINAYSKIDMDSAYYFAIRTHNIIKQEKSEVELSNLYYELGNLYTQRSEYDIALEYLSKSRALIKTTQDSSLLSTVLTGIGIIYHFQSDDSIAENYYLEALEIAQAIQDESGIASAYLNLGSIKMYEDPVPASRYFRKAIASYKTVNDKKSLSLCYNNLGNLYASYKSFEQAENNYKYSLELKKESGNLHGQAVTLNNLAYLNFEKAEEEDVPLKRQNHLEKAIDYAKQSLDISKKTKSLYTQRNSYGTLTRSFYALERYKEAVEAQARFMEVKDEIFTIEKQSTIEAIEAQYRTEKYAIQIDAMEKEQQLSKSRNTLIIISIIALLLFSVSVTMSLITKRKKDKLIYEKEKQIAKIKLEKKEEKERELNQELEFKSKQLSSHALNMIQKNEILNSVKSDIMQLKGKLPDSNQKNVNQILTKIKFSKTQEKDWELFRKYFEEVNAQFYVKLQAINPELSLNDKRICALIKLNMSSREISQVLNIAPNSLKSAKYRLKKRLNLDPEIDMDDFLREL